MNSTWLDRNRNLIFVTVLIASIGGIGTFYFNKPSSSEPIPIVPQAEPVTPTIEATATPEPSPTPGLVRVYVTGAVANSDVYVLPEGSIIKDVILAAGGVTAEADLERINQALELKDQQQIHVPRLGENDSPPTVQGGVVEDNGTLFAPPNSLAPIAEPGLININTASLDQLDMLPGIGPAIGQRIIDYRDQIGGFNSIEAITEVSGIGEATFAKIKPLITVE